MSAFFASTVAAGLAGFDPASLLIGLGALASGRSRRAVLTFTALIVGGTAVWGVLLSSLLGPQIQALHHRHLASSGALAGGIELGLGVVVLGWGLWRLLRRNGRRGKDSGADSARDAQASPAAGGAASRSSHSAGLALIALGFVAVVVGDPAFDVQVVESARVSLAASIAGWMLWSVLSQLPLVILACAVAIGRYRRLATWMDATWRRLSPIVHRLGTVLILAAGILLVADGLRRLLVGA
ncbi:MAG: hypothetical protein Q4G21_07045 [Dermabacter sp.]|nr:hypothetical protein [Dermabacter sp.]